MNADAVFFQGSSHPVCQDYASVHRNRAGTFAFLADGCSGSQHTDFGSRFLVHSAMRLTDQAESFLIKNPSFFCDKIFAHQAVWIAENYRKGMALPSNSIDATLLGLYYAADGYIYGMMYGDGCLVTAYRNEDGKYRYVYYSTEYPGGYPNYPSYEIDQNRKCEFVNLSKGEAIVTRRDHTEYELSGSYLDDDNENYIVTSPETDILLPTTFQIPADGLAFAAMTSDGIDTFYYQEVSDVSTTNVRIGIERIIPSMFPIKNFQGVFLRRRLQRFFRDARKDGWNHEDDLSVIAIGGF